MCVKVDVRHTRLLHNAFVRDGVEAKSVLLREHSADSVLGGIVNRGRRREKSFFFNPLWIKRRKCELGDDILGGCSWTRGPALPTTSRR
jgi:hypothetical protein